MTNKIDLYYVHLFNDFSGSPRVLRDAIDSEICEADNTFVFTSHHQGFLDGVNAKRVNSFYARSNNRYIQLCYFLLSQVVLFTLLGSYLLVGLCQGRKSTIVINTMLPFGAGLIAKIMQARVVYYVHETFIKPDLLKKILRFFIEHCATHVIFVSKYLQAQESFNKPSQQVIYNGLRSDFPVITEIDKEAKFAGKTLFFAGSLKAYKGIEQLVLLAEHLPEFKVVAALNCQESELSQYLTVETAPENIRFVARPANIQQYFKASFAVLNLSLPDAWIETFGLSLIEGMAYGSPVISPPVGGPTEFVNHRNGSQIDARDTTSLVAFIRQLNSSISVWNSYSEQASISAKRFTAQEYQKSVRDFFTQHNLA